MKCFFGRSNFQVNDADPFLGEQNLLVWSVFSGCRTGCNRQIWESETRSDILMARFSIILVMTVFSSGLKLPVTFTGSVTCSSVYWSTVKLWRGSLSPWPKKQPITFFFLLALASVGRIACKQSGPKNYWWQYLLIFINTKVFASCFGWNYNI